MENYGKLFKQLREERDLTLSKVARESHISKSTLSRFENGETQLAIDKFIAAISAMKLEMTISEDKESQNLFKDNQQVVGSDSDYLILLQKIDNLRHQKDMAGLFSLQIELSENNLEEKIIKILVKKVISDLGLNMVLPEEDMKLLDSFFEKGHMDSPFYNKLLLYFDREISLEILNKNLENMSFLDIKNYKIIIGLLTKKLTESLQDGNLDDARFLTMLLSKTTQ